MHTVATGGIVTAPFSDPSDIHPTPDPHRSGKPLLGTRGYSETYQYLNGLDTNVHIKARNGIVTTVYANTSEPDIKGLFVVRVIVQYNSRESLVDISDLGLEETEGRKVLRDTLEKIDEQGIKTGLDESTLRYEYRFTKESFVANNGSFYHSDHDNVLSIAPVHQVAVHPYGTAGLKQQLMNEVPGDKDLSSFFYNLRIIDNHGYYGPRFINIGNVIYRIPVSKHPQKWDGVYLVTTGSTDMETGVTESTTERYSFQEADDALPIYRSVEEARTLGDLISQKKKDLEESALWIKQEEQRMKQEDQEHKAKRIQEEREREQERIQWEEAFNKRKQVAEEEAAIRKRELEEETAQRKRQAEEEATHRKREADEQKRVAAEEEAHRKRMEEERKRVADEDAAYRKRAAEEQKRAVEESAANRKRELEEEVTQSKHEAARRMREIEAEIAEDKLNAEKEKRKLEEIIMQRKEKYERIKREAEEEALNRKQQAEAEAAQRKRQVEEEELNRKRRMEQAEEEHKRKMADRKYRDDMRQRDELLEHEKRIRKLKEKEAEMEHDRKMVAETVKYLPAIVTGVVALFAVYSKLKK